MSGDIICTTSNKTIINNIYKDEYPILYNPPKPNKIIPTEYDLFRFDKFGMGSIIGQITNKGASAYASLPLLKDKYGEDSEEYQLTISRLKQSCKAQSAQIDMTKIGRQVKGIPKCWTQKNFYPEDHDLEERNDINNNILLNKRPYFFKYLYHNSKKEFNEYVAQQEYICRKNFRKPLQELLDVKIKDLTEQEKDFVEQYYFRSPLIISDSCMNMLCRHIENLDFKLKEKIKTDSMPIDFNIYKNNSVSYTREQRTKIINCLKQFKIMSQDSSVLETIDNNKINSYNDSVLIKLEDLTSLVVNNVDIVVNILVDYFYKENPKSNKDTLWTQFGKVIFDNIVNNTKMPTVFPMQDENGNIEYFGKMYSLREVYEIG